jgi:tRNA(fMet)-specific endonuclease VapC
VTNPRYMLDTDTASFSTNGRYPSVLKRLERLEGTDYCISVISRAEMMYGLQRVSSDHPSQDRIRLFLNKVAILNWTQEAADIHARIRHGLDVQGKPLQIMDLLIAAHAISIGAVLVTNNIRHFERLAPALTIENWVEP